MKRFSILAITFVLTAAMLTACRSDNGKNTTATTQVTTTAPTTRATTAPTTRPTTPQTTQRPTSPENTTIGPDGTVGTEDNSTYTDGGMDSNDTPGNPTIDEVWQAFLVAQAAQQSVETGVPVKIEE